LARVVGRRLRASSGNVDAITALDFEYAAGLDPRLPIWPIVSLDLIAVEFFFRLNFTFFHFGLVPRVLLRKR